MELFADQARLQEEGYSCKVTGLELVAGEVLTSWEPVTTAKLEASSTLPCTGGKPIPLPGRLDSVEITPPREVRMGVFQFCSHTRCCC